MTSFKQYTLTNGVKKWKFQAYLGLEDMTGKPIKTTRSSFNTKKEAQIALAQLQTEFDSNNQMKTTTNMITFDELYELWLCQYRLKVKPSSIVTSRSFIERYTLEHFNGIDLNKITVRYCQEVVNKWHSKYKQYNYIRKSVAQVLQFGVQMELIDSNPMRKTTLPRKKGRRDLSKLLY